MQPGRYFVMHLLSDRSYAAIADWALGLGERDRLEFIKYMKLWGKA